MTAIEKLQEDHKIGMAVLTELFKLKDSELKLKISSICGDYVNPENDLILDPEKNSEVKRILVNEKPSEIIISYFDSVYVGAFGITYKPEHSKPKVLIKFNKHFTF